MGEFKYAQFYDNSAGLALLMLFKCLHEKQREIFPKMESISK